MFKKSSITRHNLKTARRFLKRHAWKLTEGSLDELEYKDPQLARYYKRRASWSRTILSYNYFPNDIKN